MEPLEPQAVTPFDPQQMDAEAAAKAVPDVSPTQLIALECLLAGQSMHRQVLDDEADHRRQTRRAVE